MKYNSIVSYFYMQYYKNINLEIKYLVDNKQLSL